MAHTQDIREIVAQIIDATGNPTDADPLPDEVAEELVRRLPDDPNEWGEAEIASIDAAWSDHVAAHIAEGDALRRACQMDGRGTVGAITVTPNPEFMAGGGASPEVRGRQLAGWPSSPSWWVSLSAPDGHAETVTGEDVTGWASLLSMARQFDDDYQARVRADRERKLNRLSEAQSARQEAERQVRAATEALNTAWDAVDAAWAALNPAVAEERGAMSAAEFAAVRLTLGLTYDGLAGMLRNMAGSPVNPRTVRSWESGRDAVSASIAGQLAALEDRLSTEAREIAADGGPVLLERGDSWALAVYARARQSRPGLRAEWA